MRPPTLKDAHTHNTMITSHVKLRSRARPDQHRSHSYSTSVVVRPNRPLETARLSETSRPAGAYHPQHVQHVWARRHALAPSCPPPPPRTLTRPRMRPTHPALSQSASTSLEFRDRCSTRLEFRDRCSAPLEFRDRCSTRLEFRDRCSALPLEFRDRERSAVEFRDSWLVFDGSMNFVTDRQTDASMHAESDRAYALYT